MTSKIKVLNLYAGIGGNRKLWSNVDVTAVEINMDIARIYRDFFPDDKVIVADAHQYLLEHYKRFEFIWSSPPCQTHSRMNHLQNIKGVEVKYPDMNLWQEIIFLKHWFSGSWVVENVKTYYVPLIKPQELDRHYFWSNFNIMPIELCKKVRNDKGMTLNVKMKERNMIVRNFYNYKGDKRTLLNNCIEPELGKHIMECSKQIMPCGHRWFTKGCKICRQIERWCKNEKSKDRI
jgi:DNA (cytosine-5)-methyltransferase 1